MTDVMNGLTTANGLSGGEVFQLMLPGQAKVLTYDQNKETLARLDALQAGQQQILAQLAALSGQPPKSDMFQPTMPMPGNPQQQPGAF